MVVAECVGGTGHSCGDSIATVDLSARVFVCLSDFADPELIPNPARPVEIMKNSKEH